MNKVVVIGTGLAGYMFAKEWRKLNTEDSLVMITDSDGAFYSKPVLSTALKQQKTPEQLVVSTAQTMRQQLNVVIHTACTVQSIDSENKFIQVVDQNNQTFTVGYDQLVLAVGADKQFIPLKGNAVDSVLSVNHLTDYRAFRAAISDKKHIAILGSGLVGCEFANDLAQADYDVTVVSLDAHLLNRLVPSEIGDALQETLHQNNISFHLNCSAESVDALGNQYGVVLSHGEKIIADVVLSAVGLKPHIALAQSADLAVDQGILVNEQLQTSHPDIYALGDCAEYTDGVRMYVAPILQAAKILAKSITHADQVLQFPVMPIAVKTTLFPVVTVLPQHGTVNEREVLTSESGVRVIFYNAEKQVVGFALSGSFVKEKMEWVKKMELKA